MIIIEGNERYCTVAESIEESLKQIKLHREGKITLKTWNEFIKENKEKAYSTKDTNEGYPTVYEELDDQQKIQSKCPHFKLDDWGVCTHQKIWDNCTCKYNCLANYDKDEGDT